MILIFDYFETLVNNCSIDFNRGLKPLWEKHYRDRCDFEDIKQYGEELFRVLQASHKEGREFPFVKEELPLYAERYGGDVITMNAEEEADFLMLCNDMEPVPGIRELLSECEAKNIPMYVLSNSGFTAGALWIALNRLGIGQYFKRVWSSADFGRIKPYKELYDMAFDGVFRDNPGAGKDDILFVGDLYETDIVGAHNAGIKSVWINRKGETDTDGYATYQIAETRELSRIIKQIETKN